MRFSRLFRGWILVGMVGCNQKTQEGLGDAGTADGGESSGGADAASEANAGDAAGASTVACPGVPRPQLTATQAAQNTILSYLAQSGSLAAAAGLTTDNWDPTAGVGDVATFAPAFTVAATGGTQTSVQAAITAAVARGGTDRIFIAVSPGMYREVVCVPNNAPPITLYGTNADPEQTVITYDNYNGEAPDSGASINPCSPPSATSMTFGTNGSATFAAFANGFRAKNLTFQNGVTPAMLLDPDGGPTKGTQAVALYTQADQILLENVNVLGHQDTLYMESPSSNQVVRAYVKSSIIAGDVDFIFGGATMVFDDCEIRSVSDRRSPTTALSPSTDSRANFGILVTNSRFTADLGVAAGRADLGRAWDRSCGSSASTYLSACVSAGHYPNGQAVVRESVLGAHLSATPWAVSATTSRPFCSMSWPCTPDGGSCPANRLFEYNNTGPGALP